MFPKSPVKGYFSSDKVRLENCFKKRGDFTFHPEISFKKRGGFSFSLSLSKNKKYRGYIEQCFRFRGISKAGKACKKPAKGGWGVGQIFCQSGDRGCYQRERTSICVPSGVNTGGTCPPPPHNRLAKKKGRGRRRKKRKRKWKRTNSLA